MLPVAAVLALIAAAPFASASLIKPLLSRQATSRISSGCSSSGALSCSSSKSGTCCFEAPGGLLLQTQFWDTSPSTGPSNSWTIHGLWPDNCDGTFTSNCDSSRDYTDIGSLLSAQGGSSTLSYMQTFWKNDPNDGTDASLWAHEWAAHGTCYSTLHTSCLPSGSPKGAEAVAFFETTVNLFKTLPTYEWLAAAGITPSSSTTHTLASLTSALRNAWGFTPALSCTGSNLGGISYYFHVSGSLIDGTFQPIDSPSSSTCPSSGIKYLTKTGSPVGTTTVGGTTTHRTTATGTRTTTSPTNTATGTPGNLPSTATIQASSVGGLLSLGTWSTQTLATYHLSGTTDSFTMTTSKGSCGVSGGQLACGSGASTTSFSLVSSGGSLLLASDGSTDWSSSNTPSGQVQEAVFSGTGQGISYTLEVIGS
ncbi:unnamed protein product [Mycena citricolor]|uniref:Ribonuclease T2-like n=1 Tax=Mycena citricolor TaxID=2018698 RepID=A0AAD2HLN1_9AGAR|nr:unnamed protein product [Mycena citricolor]